MQNKAFTSALAAGFVATAAYGQSSAPPGWYIDGYAQYSYADSSGFDPFNIGRVDLTFGYENIGSSPFGFSFGIDAISIDGNDEFEIYPALTWRSGNHLISAGMTRPALESGYLPTRQFARSLATSTELDTVEGSLLGISLLSGSNGDNLGVRWDGSFGPTSIGASYNRLDNGASPGAAHIYDLAVRYEMPGYLNLTEFAAFAGYEQIEVGPVSENSWRLGVEGQANRLGFGFMFTDFGLFDLSVARTWVDWQVSDKIEISADLGSIDTPTDSSLAYGLGAAYFFSNEISLEASGVKFENSDAVFEVSARFQF